MALPVISKGLPQRLCFTLGEFHRVYSLSLHLLKTTQFNSSNCALKIVLYSLMCVVHP